MDPKSEAKKVAVLNRQRRVPFNLSWVRGAADLALVKCLDVSDDDRFALRDIAEIGVVIVSDARIAKLHVDFMGITGPTDVITFDHGEIIISAETARENADLYDHPIEHELALYTIHGLLHLNGFDDLAARPAARMRRVQERMLREIIQLLPPP